MERTQVLSSLKEPLNSLASNLKESINNKEIVDKFGQVLVATHQEESEKTKHNNDRLLYIVIAIGILLTVALLFLGMRWYKKLDFKTIALENLIVFMLIAALEVFFFFKVAIKYEPTSSEELQRDLYKSMITELDKP